jgi:hypothetical protein
MLDHHCRKPTLKECEDEIHTLEMGTWEWDSRNFRVRLQRSKHLTLGCFLYHWKKLLKCKCRKCAYMSHLDIYNTSYEKNKD